MKKVLNLLALGVFVFLSSCSKDESITNGIMKNNNSSLGRYFDPNRGYLLSQRPTWKDQYGQTHIEEGCIDSYNFCDPRPIVNPIGDELSRSKYHISFIGMDKLLVSCYEKVPYTTEQFINAGIDVNLVDGMIEQFNTSVVVLNDEVLPSFICENEMPSYSGQTVVIKSGTYQIDYSSNPNGDVLYNIEIN